MFGFLWFLSVIGIILSAVAMGKTKKNSKFIFKTFKQAKVGLIAFICLSLFNLCVASTTETSTQQTNANNTNTENIITENVENNESTTNIENQNNAASTDNNDKKDTQAANNESKSNISLSNIPAFSGKPYVAINNNTPFFSDSDLTKDSYEKYSDLDCLGRCGFAIANVGKDLMPTGKRGDIGMIKPSGWHTVKYDGISGKYLYNRCHLIGYQLTAENANEKNLITGTRYLNVDGMLPFENMVADYIKETNNHVLYRATPIFDGNNLVASGVLMEAKSVEDNGKGVLFNVYCYNVQDGITIDYTTGDSSGTGKSETTTSSSSKSTSSTKQTTKAATPKATETKSSSSSESGTYILNTNSKTIHKPGCASVKKMKESNKKSYTGSKADLINQGYKACKNCNP